MMSVTRMTIFEALNPAFMFQRCLGLGSFTIKNNQFVSTNITKFLQIIPLLLYTFGIILIFQSSTDSPLDMINFNNFINVHFSLATAIPVIIIYIILITSVIINSGQIKFYNAIIEFDNKIDSKLNIQIDYKAFYKSIRNGTIYAIGYFMLYVVAAFFILKGEKGLFFITFYLTPEFIAIMDGLCFLLAIKLINDRVKALVQQFENGITSKNLAQRFEMINNCLSDLCDMIRFQSDVFGFRLVFNIAFDFCSTVSLMFLSYWIYTINNSIGTALYILTGTTSHLIKIIALTLVCQLSTNIVSKELKKKKT